MSVPYDVRASAIVRAPAARVYAILADYRDDHRRILPPQYFTWLDAEQGGVGAGTVIRVGMRVMGRARSFRAAITEPEHGRVLVETDLAGRVETTFLVEPAGPSESRVTIRSVLSSRRGVAGVLERFATKKFLGRVYAAELTRLAEYAEGRQAHAPIPRSA
jgi:hypothetical protein